MSLTRSFNDMDLSSKGARSHSAQGLTSFSSHGLKIPLPPRLWITDISDESSEDMESILRDDSIVNTERPRVRSRFRHHKQRSTVNMPIGIFWDIENCQVPRGCSAIDVVAAIRSKFLTGRREADFVVVCDVRKESAFRLQELNDAQVSLIHVCGTQKNAADEKLRQCMRRFGELHSAPAALLLISGDINFAADLSDFRHRKNMEVILIHKQNSSPALIACASSHYCFYELTAHLPRKSKVVNQMDDDGEPVCELEIVNLPAAQSAERITRRLRRLADNCGGKVLRVFATTAMIRFPTPDHAMRALKRMDGEDVFGCKIGTRLVRAVCPPVALAYSSDEGYGTTTAATVPPSPRPPVTHSTHHHYQQHQVIECPREPAVSMTLPQPRASTPALNDWSLALQQLPIPPRNLCPPPQPPPPPPATILPRKIRGTHGSSTNLDQSCSSVHSGDEPRYGAQHRAMSPWNSSFSEISSDEGAESTAELTVSNLPPLEPRLLQEMLTQLFALYVPVVRASVWVAGEGPVATVVFRSEWDARLAIARVHKRRLENQWSGRRLELSLGRPSPAPNLDVLRARLRAILLDQKSYTLPLMMLRDAYASRHCCALTTSDIAKVKDTVIINERFGRMVQLIDTTPVTSAEMEEAPWKCHIHGVLNAGPEDGTRILAPVYMEISVLTKQVHLLLESHGGILPLLSFVECYEASFQQLLTDAGRGVALELLLRSVPGVVLRDNPSRHITWRTAADITDRQDTPSPLSLLSDGSGSRSSRERERPRTAPALEPMLTLFERELIDLLRTAPRCSIPFSKLIPAFHHHFGRQCRVADYGFTKLPDLLAALSNTIVVLGSGSSRVITISAAAQSRRWTSDLVKVIRAQPGRAVFLNNIPQVYAAVHARPFTPVDYGVCTLQELVQRVNPASVVFCADGTVSLPRRAPTAEEKARTVQFAVQAIELLCYTPNLRMEFSRFVPAYHAHFGRQLRVAHYGCVKLLDLFELIPDSVSVHGGAAAAAAGGEREVRLAVRPARAVVGQRLRAITPLPLAALSKAYADQFGAPPLPDMLQASTLEQLVLAAGGALQAGLALAPGDAPHAVSGALAAVAALSSDRSVRGSTEEYFAAAIHELTGQDPDWSQLVGAGVITRMNRRVLLSAGWRVVWRLAQILIAQLVPLTAAEIYAEYTKRYEPTFPSTELGFENALELLRHYREVFSEDGAQRFSVCPGVIVPRGKEYPTLNEDFSIHDTPPGQKGSRVFESPTNNIWCSPPASALPTPSALLTLGGKRRTRLAAQFNIA